MYRKHICSANSLRIIAAIIVVIIVTMVVIIAYNIDNNNAGINSEKDNIKTNIIGKSFTCNFYDNEGQQFMSVHGDKINMTPNVVIEVDYEDVTAISKQSLTSVMTIIIDGSQMTSCGTTILFIEDGLKPDVDFDPESIKKIESESDSFTDMTGIANIVNQFKNFFGKPTVLVIQSQLGDPICAFSGEDVYWEVCKDLPKTTKLMIDGRALYIHRANFQIIDKDLISIK